MKNLTRAAFVSLAVAVAVAGRNAVAGDRVELTVFGGVSLLNASHDETVYPPCVYPTEPIPIDFAPPCGPIVVSQHLGASLLHGTSVGYRVSRRAALEAVFSLAPSHHLGSDGYQPPGSFVAYHLDAAITYDLLQADARPFLSAGFGRTIYGGMDLKRDGDWSVNVGAGISARLADRARLRLEAVDHIVPDHVISEKTAHDIHVRIGVTVLP